MGEPDQGPKALNPNRNSQIPGWSKGMTRTLNPKSKMV